jgi:Rho-type GTPase-activating protein 1/2
MLRHRHGQAQSYTQSNGTNAKVAGNRWHLNCFRCNTCGTLLDSDANLLLLGDGSLICNNCTYSCSACGNKIEDLAILTGDQAFCASCFRCRNCKRKIENLRYARTSQGIFCMNCHESLMARRRKKSKAVAAAKAREKDASPMVVDKSLPALPPNAIPNNAFSNDRVDPDSPAATELSPPPRPTFTRHDSTLSSPRSISRTTISTERQYDKGAESGGLSVPPVYRNNRNSTVFSGNDAASNASGGDDQAFFIPVALDPSPAPSATPRLTPDIASPDLNKKPKDRDYFNVAKSGDTQPSAAHIASLIGRQASTETASSPVKEVSRKLSKKKKPLPPSTPSGERPLELTNGKSRPQEEFKLQEAPKSKKLNARTGSQSSSPKENVSRSSSDRKDKDNGVNGSLAESPRIQQASGKPATPRTSQDSHRKDEDDARSKDSSLKSLKPAKPITRKELPSNALRPGNGMLALRQHPPSPRRPLLIQLTNLIQQIPSLQQHRRLGQT